METGTMHDLKALGFGPFFQAQLDSWADPALVPARVAAEHRGAYEVWTAEAAGQAKLAGRLRRALAEDEAPTAGDWVALREAPGPDTTAMIERVFARRTVFTRGAAGREVRVQVVAANVDLIYAVSGMDADFNLHRIQRYLARIHAGGAAPGVILNKADLCPDVAGRVLEVEQACPGVPVHAVSALRGEGLAAIRAAVGPGMTAAFLGSSGTGKSTLINALLGGERMATGAVREVDGKGRHTTSHRQLLLLPDGGLLLDTPGMRELQIAGGDGLDTAFADVVELAAQCRYPDCRHASEPGCAVKAAVAAGTIDAERLAHYRQLEKEGQAFALRHDVRQRREAERAWGRRYAQAVKQLKPKRREAR
jgi:ribosome biogenesis GTPase